MPTVTQAQVDKLGRLIHEANIYINCTKPADAADVALTSGAPAGGSWVGLTSGETTWKYKPTLDGVEVEQATGKIAPRNTAEAVNVTFTCAEADYNSVKLAIGTGGTTATTAGSGSTPSKTTVSMGGKVAVSTQTIVLVASLGTYTYMASPVSIYEWFVVYNAVSADGAELPFKRNNTRMVKVNLEGWPDVTRTEGDQTAKYGYQYDPN